MKELTQYLKDNNISFVPTDDQYLSIGDMQCCYVEPNEDGLLFDDSFEMFVNKEKGINYVFKFGGVWYYTEDPYKVKLNHLKYIGKSTLDNQYPFMGIHGKYELLNGSRGYKDWCKKASFLGIETLGICEKNTMAGLLNFQQSCLSNGIKPILGATYTVERGDYRYDAKVYVQNKVGWTNILKINKAVKIDNNGFIPEVQFLKLLGGLRLVIDPKSLDFDKLFPVDIQNDIYYQLDTVEYSNNDRDKWYLENLKKFIKSEHKPILITDAYYLNKEDYYIKDKLNQIGGFKEYSSENQYFKSHEAYHEELALLFKDSDMVDGGLFDRIYFNAVNNLVKLSVECDYLIDMSQKYLPKYIMREEEKKQFKTNEDLFWHLIEKGVAEKCPKGEEEKYLDRVMKEYEIISYGGLVDYFLINWDQVRWCGENNIMTGIGRGSAAGSLISFCLNITRINPFDYDLIFERFLTKSRAKGKIADIDIDHEQLRRDEVKQYHREKYGYDRCCSVGTYTAMQLRGTLKDLAKLEGIDFSMTNRISSMIGDCEDVSDIFTMASGRKELKKFITNNVELFNSMPILIGSLKSSSTHASAFIIVPDNKTIYEYMPVRLEEGELVSEWEGYDLEDYGALKQDVLGLKTLDKYHHTVDSIRNITGKSVDIFNLPLNNKDVFNHFCDKNNSDIFQFGSKGLSDYVGQLKPNNINDVIAAVALYRPGAMDNNFHNEYIFIKDGQKDPEYMWGTEDITKNTFGIPIYQEQIMFICQKLGKFDLDETDEIRRGLGKKKLDVIMPFKEKFINNAIDQGCPEIEANEIWDKLEKFAGYSFNLSHAAAYGITGYIGQWLKVHYPIHFWTTAFTFAGDDDYAGYISEIYKTGSIKLTPPDINRSAESFTTDFENNSIAWSLLSIKQVGDKAVEQILEDRKSSNYYSLEEFMQRNIKKGSKVNKSVIENLILSGAFDEVEGVTVPRKRINLINQYREKYAVKIDKAKDLFTLNEDSLKEDWWWLYQQKKLSGFAFFPYNDMCNEVIEDKSFEYMDVEDLEDESNKGNKVCVGGYISEFKEGSMRSKGLYCRMQLESNYSYINVLIWPDQYEYLKEGLQDCEGKVILMSGVIGFDKYSQKNMLYSADNSEIMLLD